MVFKLGKRQAMRVMLHAALCVSVATATGCGADIDRSPVQSWGGEEQAKLGANPQAELTGTALAVMRFGNEHYPQHFTGVALGQGSKILVYRTPTRDLDQALIERFPRAELVFLDREYTARQLEDAVQSVLADLDYWRGHGIQIASVGPSSSFDGVVVQTSQAGSVEDAFRQRYGDIVALMEPQGDFEVLGPAQN